MSNSAKSIAEFFKKREKSVVASEEDKAKVEELVENSPPSRENESATSETFQPKTQVACVQLPFEELCQVFEKIEATTKRLVIGEILTEFYGKLMSEQPDVLLSVVYLCLCRLGPAYEGLELGLGEALLMKAIAHVTGRPMSSIKSDFEEQGDLGLVAQMSRSNQSTMFKPKRLACPGVYRVLKEIAAASGSNAVGKKLEKIRSLLVACEGVESKYLMRMLVGKLRIGLAEQSILIALAHASAAAFGPPKEAQDAPEVVLKSVFNSIPNYDLVIPALLKWGIWRLGDHCRMVPGIPLKPMLAHPTKSLSQVLDRFESRAFTCEFKYDGERAQIHCLVDEGKFFIYSRNSENMSQKYPDVLSRLPEALNLETVKSFVMDCEVVAWDPESKKILPFQILSTRKRKDVTVESVQVQVVLFAFDLLYLNGEELLRRPLRERRELLHQNFRPVAGFFDFAKYSDSTTVEDIQAFLEDAVQSSCEGLMVKILDGSDASYEPSRRSRNWLKVKKDYLEGIGDSLDLVVLGGYIGKGKRTGVFGGFLLGCASCDEGDEEYQPICKLGTGFSEADLEELSQKLRPHIIPQARPYYRLPTAGGSSTEVLKPDVWFDAHCVWEVKAADFSLSPIYTAGWGLVEGGRGISLRFPRFLRDRSDEKSPEDATNAHEIAELYRQQASATATGNEFGDEDDYY